MAEDAASAESRATVYTALAEPEFRHELNDMKQELRDLGRLFDRRMRLHWADPQRLRRIREVVNRARQDIEAILSEERVTQ